MSHTIYAVLCYQEIQFTGTKDECDKAARLLEDITGFGRQVIPLSKFGAR